MSRTQQKLEKSDETFGSIIPTQAPLAALNTLNKDEDILSVPAFRVKEKQDKKVNQSIKGYVDDGAPVQENLRAHQLGSKVIDLTHDTLPETTWKPIEKTFDKVPPQFYIEEKSKTLLKEWEAEQHAEFYKFVYDRRGID